MIACLAVVLRAWWTDLWQLVTWPQVDDLLLAADGDPGPPVGDASRQLCLRPLGGGTRCHEILVDDGYAWRCAAGHTWSKDAVRNEDP